MRTRIALLLILWMAMVCPLVAQNGVPQIINTSQLPFSGSTIINFVIIDEAGYVLVHSPNYLVKFNLQTKQIQWIKNCESSFWSQNLVKTPDNNICYSDGSKIIKLSAVGDTLWTRELSTFDNGFCLSTSSSNFLTCYGLHSNLVLIDYSSGAIIGHWSIMTGGNSSCSYHNVYAVADSIFYLFDDMPLGATSNTGIKMTKIQIINNTVNYVWYLQIDDLLQIDGLAFDNVIYMSCRQLNPWNNSLIYKIIDQGDDYFIESIIDITGANTTGFITSMLADNNSLLLTAGIILGDDPNCEDGVMGSLMCMSHNSQNDLIWRVDQTITPWCLAQAVATKNTKIYVLSICQEYYGGPKTFWLTELSTDTANDDPPPPFDPKLNLTCYPNPFKGNTKIKFNQIDDGPTTMSIYNIKGQLVRTLMEGELLPVGEHEVSWDGKTASGQQAVAGIYLCKLRSKEHSATRKVILVR